MTDICETIRNAVDRIDPFIFHMLGFVVCLVLIALASLGIAIIIEKVSDRHE